MCMLRVQKGSSFLKINSFILENDLRFLDTERNHGAHYTRRFVRLVDTYSGRKRSDISH